MPLENIDVQAWDQLISRDIQQKAVQSLENGKVLYFPRLPFSLSQKEHSFLSPSIADPKSKNISYDIRKDRLSGTVCREDLADQLKEMIRRYAQISRKFLEHLIPGYAPFLIQAKTSFRPVEISGRKSPSYRKDDTLLHVDSFPSSPTKGQRILRIFTNVNPEGKARVWRLGEPFEDVIEKIIDKVSSPIWGVASMYQLLGITKDYRTDYDHYMLQVHNKMKEDRNYQKNVPQKEVQFPAGSTWIVYTDQVSHAAMSGQHVLEQTFHLPVNGIQDGATNPLKVLEKRLKKALI